MGELRRVVLIGIARLLWQASAWANHWGNAAFVRALRTPHYASAADIGRLRRKPHRSTGSAPETADRRMAAIAGARTGLDLAAGEVPIHPADN